MKLITEQIEEIQVITESKNGKQNLYITGPFLQAEITNRNGRCYSYNILEREVNKYNDKYIKSGRALGELGHPEGPTVNLDRVSHMITSLVPEGKNFIGKAKLSSCSDSQYLKLSTANSRFNEVLKVMVAIPPVVTATWP